MTAVKYSSHFLGSSYVGHSFQFLDMPFFYLYGPANSLSVLPKFFESSVFKGIVCKVRLACEAMHLPVVLTTC